MVFLVFQLNLGPDKSKMAQIADLHPSIPSDIMTLANTFLEDNRCFRALSPESIKEAHLHPRVTNETTIQEYYDRTLTQSYRDRQEFHLYIPFEDRLNKMLDKLDQLLEKVEALDRKTEKSDKKIEEQRSEMEEQRSKMEEQNSKIKKLEETNLEIKTDRFELSLGNMLIELTRILAYKYKPHIATDRDTKRLKKFAATLRDNQLHAENIPQTCWGDIRNLKDVRYISGVF